MTTELRFEYTRLGQARLLVGDGEESHPIEGNYIYGVRRVTNMGTSVLGLVQENPAVPGLWRAVVAPGDTFPVVDYTRGLWSMTPGRTGFANRRTAALYLLGMKDAQTEWFARALAEQSA